MVQAAGFAIAIHWEKRGDLPWPVTVEGGQLIVVISDLFFSVYCMSVC